MKLIKQLTLLLCLAFATGTVFTACEGEVGPAGADGKDGVDGTNGINGANGADGMNGMDGFGAPLRGPFTPLEASITPKTVFDLKSDFSSVQLDMVMTSEDILTSDSSFVYGSYMDGAALFDNGDGTYVFINNLERDYSIARIIMNDKLQPLHGDYIVNSIATGYTAQCSGSGISQAEHGFGPYYLSGGEWGGDNKGVYVVDPMKSAAQRTLAQRSAAMGEWSTENAVAIGKDAYADKTVVFIGDDDSNNSYPEGHFGMYVGERGDLFGGDLYVLRGKNATETAPGSGGLKFEMGMTEGTTYDVEWVAMEERTISELNQEAIDSVAIGFQRIEDIDWRRGSAANQRTLFFCVTGRRRSDNPALADRGTTFGRIYMVELNATGPTGDAKITCVLDGDKEGGIADGFHSPDNITVTENYVYIQEDPNGYAEFNSDITGYAKLYQYSIADKTLKTVLECDQTTASGLGYGNTSSMWEITGLIDVTDIIGANEPTFLCGAQVHGWNAATTPNTAKRADGLRFFDPTAIDGIDAGLEGSFLFKLTGLPR
ncbi:MAG: phosphatase [Cyclobacteriaceae bacterium]